MDIGVPREIKAQEGRVALMPVAVADLVRNGHRLRVERGAGVLSGAADEAYAAAGAELVDGPEAVFAASQMIVKVKEILPPEYGWLRRDHILFTNIHSALNRELTDQTLDVGLSAIAAEETHENGSPNCPLAGEVGAFEGIRLCLAPHGGIGRHFMGHFGSAPLTALVIGLGQVGGGTLRTLLRLGASVVGFDISCDTCGAIETCRPTRWADPVYEIDGIRHFCVDNIPGAVPVTASAGYSHAIHPFVSLVAEKGVVAACREKPWLARGLTCVDGTLILEETGRLQNRPFTPVDRFLAETL